MGGDSAGGNLTAACAASLTDDSEVDIKKILLIYGVFDFLSMGEAANELPDTDTDLMMREMMLGSYLGPERDESYFLILGSAPFMSLINFPQPIFFAVL